MLSHLVHPVQPQIFIRTAGLRFGVPSMHFTKRLTKQGLARICFKQGQYTFVDFLVCCKVIAPLDIFCTIYFIKYNVKRIVLKI